MLRPRQAREGGTGDTKAGFQGPGPLAGLGGHRSLPAASASLAASTLKRWPSIGEAPATQQQNKQTKACYEAPPALPQTSHGATPHGAPGQAWPEAVCDGA